MILKYRLFRSSEEFETFQADKNISVCQITPVVSTIKMEADMSKADGSINVAVFVVFRENVHTTSDKTPPSATQG